MSGRNQTNKSGIQMNFPAENINPKAHQYPACNIHSQPLSFTNLSIFHSKDQPLRAFCEKCVRQRIQQTGGDSANNYLPLGQVLEDLIQNLKTKNYPRKDYSRDDTLKSINYLAQSCLIYAATFKELNLGLLQLAEDYQENLRKNSIGGFLEKAISKVYKIIDTKYPLKVSENLERLKQMTRLNQVDRGENVRFGLVFDEEKFIKNEDNLLNNHRGMVNSINKSFKQLEDIVQTVKHAMTMKNIQDVPESKGHRSKYSFTNKINPDSRDSVAVMNKGLSVKKTVKSFKHCFILCEPCLDVTQDFAQITFRINKKSGWIAVGCSSLQKLKANQYELSNLQCENKNSFLLDSNGVYHPLVEKKKNSFSFNDNYNPIKTFKFGQGSVVSLVLNFQDNTLKFENLGTRESFTVSAKCNLQIFQGDLHPCVNLYSQNDEVELL